MKLLLQVSLTIVFMFSKSERKPLLPLSFFYSLLIWWTYNDLMKTSRAKFRLSRWDLVWSNRISSRDILCSFRFNWNVYVSVFNWQFLYYFMVMLSLESHQNTWFSESSLPLDHGNSTRIGALWGKPFVDPNTFCFRFAWNLRRRYFVARTLSSKEQRSKTLVRELIQ